MIGILKTFGRLGSILALIFLVITLLRQLIMLVGVLLAIVKIAIIIAFVALFVMIVLAILRDRAVVNVRQTRFSNRLSSFFPTFTNTQIVFPP